MNKSEKEILELADAIELNLYINGLRHRVVNGIKKIQNNDNTFTMMPKEIKRAEFLNYGTKARIPIKKTDRKFLVLT
jgi:hypothetical protein